MTSAYEASIKTARPCKPMKKRHLVILCAMLGTLLASGVSASADPPRKLVPLTSALSSTVISGYVGAGITSTTGRQAQPPAQVQHGGWWQAFLFWFRSHF